MSSFPASSLLSLRTTGHSPTHFDGGATFNPDGVPAPEDISTFPDAFATDSNDHPAQSKIMDHIIGTSIDYTPTMDPFNSMTARSLSLSHLKEYFDHQNPRVMDILSHRHFIQIDNNYCIPMNQGRIHIDTKTTVMDFHLTVGRSIGLAPILPNTTSTSTHHFTFDMDLHQPQRLFSSKHAMLGFDPAGSMLYIGTAMHEDVFLAMAPNAFLLGESKPCRPGFSTGSSLMSTRHYRQVVVMIVHFLHSLPQFPYRAIDDLYSQDLTGSEPEWERVTGALSDPKIYLNLEDVRALDSLITHGYRRWIDDAPDQWKEDGFLEERSPILVTSCYGQEAGIAVRENGGVEAAAWGLKRDYSKLSYLTFSLATYIRCTEIVDWEVISLDQIKARHGDAFYDGLEHLTRKDVDIDTYPLLDADGLERPVYDSKSKRVTRRKPRIQNDAPSCGVLIDLKDIHNLFPSENDMPIDGEGTCIDDGTRFPPTQVDAYPLAFLRTAGNIQATDVPDCFHPVISKINSVVKKPSCDDENDVDHPYLMDVDVDDGGPGCHSDSPLRAIGCQIYSHITHRAATQAGQRDAHQGSVTAALAGMFANTPTEKDTARQRKSYCDQALPSTRFRRHISSEECPKSCRAELVYSVDVRRLKDPSGTVIFNDIVARLAQAWSSPNVCHAIKEHLVVLKPDVFPALYDWVSYPVTCIIEWIYRHETIRFEEGILPCPLRLELLACCERLLYFCYTGNTAVLAKALMDPLGLSRGVLKDGFPTLLTIFKRPEIHSAFNNGIQIDHRCWPLKSGYPAVASKRAQVLSYSLRHYLSYQAILRMNHFAAVRPQKGYRGLLDPSSNKAMAILKIVFDAFFEDTKRLVQDGVEDDIRVRLLGATSDQSRQEVATRAESRRAALRKWLDSPMPLDYGSTRTNSGDTDTSHTFLNLAQAVAHSEDDLSHGLPHLSENPLSPSGLVDSIIQMARPGSSASSAPVLSNGGFLPLLKLTYPHLEALSNHSDEESRSNFISSIFLRALDTFKVHFVPYHYNPNPPTGPPGNPVIQLQLEPVFDCWAQLSQADERRHALLSSGSSQPSLPPSPLHLADMALELTVDLDSNADWDTHGLTLELLGKRMLNKTSLPTNYKPPGGSHIPWVNETYSWVQNVYDGTKPIHHLALLTGVITSLLIPNIFIPDDKKSCFRDARTADLVRKLCNSIPWVSKKGRRGVADKRYYVSMVTTFIIALYEPDSPLRKHMDMSKRQGMGQAWTSKHTVKGITYTLLIRLGILWGEGAGALEKGTFGVAWGLHPEHRINLLYISLKQKLEGGEYCAFDALSLLIGHKNARAFCKRLGHTARPHSPSAP